MFLRLTVKIKTNFKMGIRHQNDHPLVLHAISIHIYRKLLMLAHDWTPMAIPLVALSCLIKNVQVSSYELIVGLIGPVAPADVVDWRRIILFKLAHCIPCSSTQSLQEENAIKANWGSGWGVYINNMYISEIGMIYGW